MKLEIYTDGACSGNQFDNANGGWAYAMTDDDDHILDKNSGFANDTTNNRMELTAVVNALESLVNGRAKHHMHKYEKFIIYSDSAYIVNCFNQGWYKKWMNNGWKTSKKKPVKNQDLWQAILLNYLDIKEKVTFKYVKGHDGNKWNEYVDKLAVNTMNLL